MPDMKEVLANSYSTVIKDHFDNNPIGDMEQLSVEQQEVVLNNQLRQYENQREEIMRKWGNTPIEELRGLTPTEFVNSIENFSDVYDLFIYMVEHTDEDMPYIIIEKLKEYSDTAIQKLSDMANKHLNDGDDIFLSAVLSALGQFKAVDAVRALIDIAYKLNEKGLELEHVEEALKNSGSCAIEQILEIVESKQMEDVEKMLLYVLAFVGSNAKNERIYRVLKSTFRTMDDKMNAVICINAYGDGRAVPMLRGYLQKNNVIQKDLFYEILGTIQLLGGQIDEFLK